MAERHGANDTTCNKRWYHSDIYPSALGTPGGLIRCRMDHWIVVQMYVVAAHITAVPSRL